MCGEIKMLSLTRRQTQQRIRGVFGVFLALLFLAALRIKFLESHTLTPHSR